MKAKDQFPALSERAIPGINSVVTSFSGCILFVGMFSGCGQSFEPSFGPREATQTLSPEAQTAVAEQMNAFYGNYEKIEFPLNGPTHWNGVSGVVEEVVTADEDLVSLKTKIKQTTQPITDGDKIRFQYAIDSDPPLEDQELLPWLGNVKEYSAEDQVLTVAADERYQSERQIELLIRPSHRLETGKALFRQYCFACHGITGAGDGPQSQVLNPKPRDFRLGIFKYTSTIPKSRASHDDLEHVIKNGIAGTGMQAFKLLGNHEVTIIADYIRYLAIRGEVEQGVAIETQVELGMTESPNTKLSPAEVQKILTGSLPELMEQESEHVFQSWFQAEIPASLVNPESTPPDPEAASLSKPGMSSLENGRQIYFSKTGQCATCHGETGKGDGEKTREFQKKPDGTKYERAGLHDIWGQPVKPRDFSYGVFHGGREPIDLYRRIYAGVKGTPMPAYAGSGLSEEDIWDLVNYVLYLAGDFPNAKLPPTSGGNDS